VLQYLACWGDLLSYFQLGPSVPVVEFSSSLVSRIGGTRDNGCCMIVQWEVP
jgi:hypothetical protein